MTDYNKAFQSHMDPRTLGGSIQYDPRYDITYNAEETERIDTIPSILVIDSKYRDNAAGTTPNNYTVTLQTAYPDVISMELVYCDIPTGGYNVIAGVNDRLSFDTDTSAGVIATVPAGLYTLDPLPGNNASSIRYAVQSALNTAASRDYFNIPTVTDVGVLQFTAAAAFAFNLDGGLTPLPQSGNVESQRRLYASRSMGSLLGFRPSSYNSQADSVTATYPPILEMDRFITLHIEGMSRCDSTNNSVQDCFCILPMDSKNSNFDLLKDGNNIDNEEYVYFFKQPRKLYKLQLTFWDMRGTLYNFQGQEHVLIFKIHTKTHKKKYIV